MILPVSTISSLLITRASGSFEKLENWCANHKVKVKAISFISIEPVLELEIPESDWIFFSSPKGTKSYLEHYPIRAKKIAAVGPGTKDVLESLNISVDFCGEAIDDTPLIGKKFNAIVPSDDVVFFPIGNRSKRSVISEIDPSKRIELMTYLTVEQQHELSEKFDAIFFTSPSNFTSYIAANGSPSTELIIAIGKTTADAILAYNIELNVAILEAPTENAVIALLQNI